MNVVLEILMAFWTTLVQMVPYLLLGFLVAGVLSVLVSPRLVERHLGGGGFLPVVKASLFGVPLPLCSCGVIPVSASLRSHGASRGATTAFLLSTPQTGADSIFVTLSLLGPVFAIVRPIAALATGIFGGLAVGLLGGDREDVQQRIQPASTDASCLVGTHRGRFARVMRYGFGTLPGDIGKSLLVGVAVAALLGVFVPDDFFAGALGKGFTGMLVMMLCGIPLYVCATSSVPVAAVLILEKGVSPGAALVFLMTGPATNAASITTIWKTMGIRTTIVYLCSLAVLALGSGLLIDAIFKHPGVPAVASMGGMLPDYVKYPAVALFLGVVGAAIWKSRRKSTPRTQKTGEQSVVLTVGGMTCSHCAESVERALSECAGVTSVQVHLNAGKATVGGANLDVGRLREAVTAIGYMVESIGEVVG